MEQGRWPITLEELVPRRLAKVPRDPTGKDPILLRCFEDGIAIYWPGPDKGCDGKGWEASNDDVLDYAGSQRPFQFRLWNPEARGQERARPIEKKVDDE